jgi:hypothetical protein
MGRRHAAGAQAGITLDVATIRLSLCLIGLGGAPLIMRVFGRGSETFRSVQLPTTRPVATATLRTSGQSACENEFLLLRARSANAI